MKIEQVSSFTFVACDLLSGSNVTIDLEKVENLLLCSVTIAQCLNETQVVL
jgi:hypothetical protein